MTNEILINYDSQIDVFGGLLFEEWKHAYLPMRRNDRWHDVPLNFTAWVLSLQFERDQDTVKDQLREEVQKRINKAGYTDAVY